MVSSSLNKRGIGVSVINTDTVVKGQFSSIGSIDIYGSVNNCSGSECVINSGGDVFVGANAEVNGGIKCEGIEVKGVVKGNIVASKYVILRKMSKVVGNIVCGSFIVEQGVCFDGKVRIVLESNLEAGHKYGNCSLVDAMYRKIAERCGKIVRSFSSSRAAS